MAEKMERPLRKRGRPPKHLKPRVEAIRYEPQEITASETPIVTKKDKRFWGERPLPQKYSRRQARVCPKCNRILLDSMSQAVICCSISKGIAYLLCRECKHRWKLPVADE